MNKYIETDLVNWNQIFELDRSFLLPFIFRGQGNENWLLSSSLERVYKECSKYNYFIGYEVDEKWMIHEFKRKFHLYSNIKISEEDNFEWLAIMQHYGAPTRLLDFTESIFIAAFFATIESRERSSIWAVNKHALRDYLRNDYKLNYEKGKALKDEVNLNHIKFANQFIANMDADEKVPLTVIPLEPKICNERLARQQGLFLMPTNGNKTFMDNLEVAYKRKDSFFEKISFDELVELSKKEQYNAKIGVFKINISDEIHRDIAVSLHEMNITSEVLFPGLEGLAKSLVHSQVII